MSQNLKHKILTQEETPKYSFRKYSFGLASALIGLTAFSGGLKGTIAKADTVSNSAVADQKDIDAKQNNKQATLDISYSDNQKQAQDSNKGAAENKNDNQVNTDQKQAANVQAKNGSQVSHNENNESKEPAVTAKKQTTAQQANSNTVKEEQESKQVVTKPQENTNTSTATKQVKNNETSATIANAMVNNGETRSAVAPKADEAKGTTTLDVNKLSAESDNTKGNFLSLLNNFAVVKSASTKAPYDIDANWDYSITKGTKTVNRTATDNDYWYNHTITATSNPEGISSGDWFTWKDNNGNQHRIALTISSTATDSEGIFNGEDFTVHNVGGKIYIAKPGYFLPNMTDKYYVSSTVDNALSVPTVSVSRVTTDTVESDTVNITGYKGTSNDVFIPNAADFKADGKNNVDAVHINPSLMRKLATRQGTTSITVSNTDGQFVDAVDDSNFTMDNSGNLPVYSVDSNGNPTNVNWNNTDLTTGGNKTTGTDLFGHHDGWKYVFQNGHQGWYYVNNGVIYNDDKLPSKTESVVTGTKKQLIPISSNWGVCGATLSNIKQNGNVYTANVNTLSLTMGHTSFDKNNPYVMHNFGTITLTMSGNSALPESDVETIIEDLMENKVGQWDYDNYNSWYYDVDSREAISSEDPSNGSSIMQRYGVSKAILEGSPYPTGGSTVTVPTKSNTQFIDYNDVKNITRSPADIASTLKSVDTKGLHGADIDPLANNTIAREYKIIENLPDGTQKVLFDWNGQINQDPDGTYNQYPAQVTVTGANGQYTQPKNPINDHADNGWWNITPDIKSGYTISVTPEYSTDDATKMGLELMPQYDSNNNLTHITFDLTPSKSMLQSQTFYVNYVANGQTSSYYFVDDDGNGQKVGEDHQISGKTDQTINFTVTAPANYELVNAQDANQSYTFKADGNAPVVIHLKHHRASATGAKNKDVDDHRTITREIDIVSPDGKQTVERQTVEFTRPATEDMVTGQITYGDWSDGGQKQMPALTLPDKSGYHADITVPAITVTPDSKPEPVKVTYVASDQAVKLSFVDRSGAVVGTKTINGKTDQTYNVSLSDLPAHYEIDGSLPVYKFTDQADQVLTVHVKQNKDDYTAIAQQITVKHGETPNASDGIKNTQDMPSGTSYAWGTEPQLPQGKTYGDSTGTVVVTFPDGSNENVTVPVHFNSEAEDNAKKGDQAVAFNGTKTYYHGQAVADLTLNDLTNADNVKSVVWANKPDTSKIGNGADSATVTFNDGTTTVINGNYTVTPNDSDKIGTIETQPITVKHGQDPASVDPKDGIKTALPDGTKVNWTTKPALPSGQTYGDTKGTAEVDFPDGSKQSVEISVHVNSDAEDNKSKGDQGVNLKVTDKVYYHGENVPDLTLNDLINADNVKSVVWANKPDTSKIGAGTDSATVTFNDGTTATVGGSYVVNPNDSDKTGTIETQPINVKHGQDPASVDPKEGIKTKLPDGTKVDWTTKPELPSGQTYGDTKGTAEVDFPDGSKQSVEIPVHFNSQAEDNAKKGDQGVGFKNPSQVYSHNQIVPDLTLNDLNNPDNVKSVVWANKPDTSKTGAGTDSATVTFNDGSTATIKGSYVVNGIDTTDLNKAIKDGQNAQKTTKYTNGSDKARKELDDALNKGIKDINNPDLNQDQADKDAKDIEDAIKKLDGKATDTTNLDKAIKDGKDAQKTVRYDNSSDKAKKDLDDAINKAVKDKKNPNLSQDQADKDAKDIEDAIKNLDGKATDTSNLNKAIKDGQNAQKSDKYKNSTSKAQKALDDAINKAINDLKNPNLTQKQADQDARAIEDAIKGLDGKANNNKQSQGTKTNTKTDGNGVVQASTIGDKTNSNELPQTGENNNTIALASGIATALTAGIGILAEGKKRKRE